MWVELLTTSKNFKGLPVMWSAFVAAVLVYNIHVLKSDRHAAVVFFLISSDKNFDT
jgi:phosphatidylserine synthase